MTINHIYKFCDGGDNSERLTLLPLKIPLNPVGLFGGSSVVEDQFCPKLMGMVEGTLRDGKPFVHPIGNEGTSYILCLKIP
ncbi:hypothetical protein [Deinococcus ficus]|uniref:hypothetical protein n=1 Tax=Deinococcus ficus TaxID=317577 RepID=UPI00200AF7E0|nr:hypothetical protein [Deinococcus ficus]